MQNFLFERTKAQEAAPEPYTLFNKEQANKEMAQESETLRDIEYFRGMYPLRVKSLQLVVEAVFNEMDYAASPIYDEYPDRVLVEQLFRRIKSQIGEETPAAEADEPPQVEAQERAPHMPYGPMYIVQSIVPGSGGYKTWEMKEEVVRAEQLDGGRGGNSWGPPPPPPPPRPWGPPPPPPRPWGPPPPPRPWGPPPPPPHPWGPPPPPPHPWGPPPPPPRPWGPPRPDGRGDLDDLIRLLLFGEMQKRRCNGRNCR